LPIDILLTDLVMSEFAPRWGTVQDCLRLAQKQNIRRVSPSTVILAGSATDAIGISFVKARMIGTKTDEIASTCESFVMVSTLIALEARHPHSTSGAFRISGKLRFVPSIT
jgi:hypothetical protein